MSVLRKILYPFSLLYGEITAARNKLYDKGMLSATQFDLPIIVVGNLSVGGTGKTPQVEYLVRLLQSQYSLAILSRGYKRSTKGFVRATNTSTAADIGDEPLQYFKKFNDVIVAVDANRVEGISQLMALENPPQVILLDDAFQHRKVAAGLNILLTPYDDLYADDMMLPTGNLREKVTGADRAQIVVVSKCPDEISRKDQFKIGEKLQVNLLQTLFFSKINYANEVIGTDSIQVSQLKNYSVLLVTGIAKTQPLEEHLKQKEINFELMKYRDHHNFSTDDISQIQTAFDRLQGPKKIILTTEKDYVRSFNDLEHCYYLPILTSFIDHQSDFNQLILNYVENFKG